MSSSTAETMSTTTAISSAGLSIADLKTLVMKDLEASNELQTRIDQLRKDVAEGEQQPDQRQVSLMGEEQKRIGKDLVLRIEQIEEQNTLTPTDREMLQALNSRLAMHDLQRMRLAEYGDLQRKPEEWLAYEKLPKDARMATDATPLAAPGSPTAPLAPSAESRSEPSHDSAPDAETTPASYATRCEQHEEEDDDGYVSNDDAASDEESEVHKSDWPLLYRIVDVDPATPAYLFEHVLGVHYRALALQHDPKRFPNDPTAAERWAACTKAYDTLADPERKRFYDHHRRVPSDLEGFDLAKLSLDE